MSSNDNSNDIAALREHLFATLAALRDQDKPMDIDRARAVSEVAGKIIDSAKVEVDYLRVTGGRESKFLDDKLPPGITGITRHRIAG